jgi:hypothetical protein
MRPLEQHARSSLRNASGYDYDFVIPGKMAWTHVSRFRDSKPSVGLMVAPLPGDSALAEATDFLVHERGWRIVSRTDESVRLQKRWRGGGDINVPLLIALVFVGVLPALIYLVGNMSSKPVRCDLLFSIVESDDEETILECIARPYRRVQQSTRAVANYVWEYDLQPLQP